MSHELSPAQRTAEARQAVLDASSDWPEPETPYSGLITMELTAPRLTYFGSIPGVLLDLEHVHRRDEHNNIVAGDREMRYDLLAKRQELVAARLAQSGPGNLAATLILRSDFAYQDFTSAGTADRLGVQVERLLAAQDKGWDIQIIDGYQLMKNLPSNTFNLVTAGDPEAPTSVYWESRLTTQAPHETWGMNPESRQWAAGIYQDLEGRAFPSDVAADFLTMAAELAQPR